MRRLAIHSERWRYIIYSDGGEELYDRKEDPNEFTNLAGKPEYASIKRDLSKFAPKTSAASKPLMTDYDFDFATYTYKRKLRN